MPWLNFLQEAYSNGLILKSSIQINGAVIALKDAF